MFGSLATLQIPMPSNKDGQNCILFSDEDSFNAICSLKDVSFITILCLFFEQFNSFDFLFVLNLKG